MRRPRNDGRRGVVAFVGTRVFFSSNAILAGVHSATIIHGKGTGALRNALWTRFKEDKRIKSFRAGAFGEGDYGVTVHRIVN